MRHVCREGGLVRRLNDTSYNFLLSSRCRPSVSESTAKLSLARWSSRTDLDTRGPSEECDDGEEHCAPAIDRPHSFRRGSESPSLPAQQRELRPGRADDLQRR